ncbi:MAG: hypothetical protein QM755_08370 [Luteolibacter sp.]
MASPTNTRSGLGGSARAHRRFFLWLVGVFVAVMMAFSFVNTWVNPLWVSPAPWTNDARFSDYRQIYRNLRTAKAGLARSKQWDTVFLGSSRVAIGLDPAMPQWGDHKVVNLGLSGGSLREQAAFVDYLFKHQKGLKTIYLGVDLTDLTTETDMARNAGFYESPLNPDGEVIEREMRYVTGVSSFIASMRTINTRSASQKNPDKLPPYTALGHWLRHRSVRGVRDILVTDSIPHSIRMIRQRKSKLEIFEKKLQALVYIVNTCLDHKVELKLLIPPNHAAYLSVFYIDHDADPTFTLDRETVVNLVADANAAHPDAPPITVWDFNDFHPLNAEPLSSADPKTGYLHYWADGTHALETLGHVMLKRMNGWPIDDPKEATYGVQIDKNNLPARIADLHTQYQKYREAYPEEIKWVEETIHKYSSAGTEKGPAEEEEGPNPQQ